MKITRNGENKTLKRRYYKNVIYILGEGLTEYRYFEHIKNLYKDEIVIVIPIKQKKHNSSPMQLLDRMEKKLKEIEFRANDEAWLVIDHDGRKNSVFAPLVKWKKNNKNFGLAVSNRDFEFWKLLHFEEGNGYSTNYKKYHKALADYLGVRVDELKKDGGRQSLHKFTKKNFEMAIRNANKREKSTGTYKDWPENPGNSNVYILAEKIHNAKNS